MRHTLWPRVTARPSRCVCGLAQPPHCGTMDAVTARPSIVILGGGPGGYEAALVAAQLGADVTIVEADGLGGAAVLTDVVPSKTLIATAEVLATMRGGDELGLIGGDDVAADLGVVDRRVRALAQAQSQDIRTR